MLRAFWYSKEKLNRGNVKNFGDELSKFILEKVYHERVKWINPQKQNVFQTFCTHHILGIGSILHFGAKNSLVWGSGLIEKKSFAPKATYNVVRGKFTRNELVSRGLKIPEVYGDPGLLTSKYFQFNNTNKKYKVGIIPHYVEVEMMKKLYVENSISKEFTLINLKDPVLEVLKEINECQLIISSSLHGIIVSQSYNIPALRVKFSGLILGDGIKYEDYFNSVLIDHYPVATISKHNFNEKFILDLFKIDERKQKINCDLIKLQDDLLNSKP